MEAPKIAPISPARTGHRLLVLYWNPYGKRVRFDDPEPSRGGLRRR